ALKLDRPPADLPVPPPENRRPVGHLVAALLVVLVLLTGANLWATLSLGNRIAAGGASDSGSDSRGHSATLAVRGTTGEEARDRFAEALHDLLVAQNGAREWSQAQDRLLAHYEQLVREHPQLRVQDANLKGKLAVGALGVLSQRSAGRVQEAVKKA